MEPMYPVVEDPAAPPSRVAHIRTAAWGLASGVADAPAFCGAIPQRFWQLTLEAVTWAECLRRAPSGEQYVGETDLSWRLTNAERTNRQGRRKMAVSPDYAGSDHRWVSLRFPLLYLPAPAMELVRLAG